MAYLLFADDDPAAVQFAAGYLEKAGHRTVVVRDGAEAIARLEDELPDVLITDVMMPRKDGFEVLQALRRQVAGKGTPVILLTPLSAEGRPLICNSGYGIVSYVLRQPDACSFGWQIILAVEQVLYGQVGPIRYEDCTQWPGLGNILALKASLCRDTQRPRRSVSSSRFRLAQPGRVDRQPLAALNAPACEFPSQERVPL
jgi:CheY-like chemotaxis protein